MEQSRKINNRFSGLGWLMISLIIALILAGAMVQGLSAQMPEAQQAADDPLPTVPADPPDGEENQPESVAATPEISPTATPVGVGVISPTEILSSTEGVTQTETAVITDSTSYTLYFPITNKSFPQMTLLATRPNSSNQWQVYWANLGVGIQYQIQESQKPDFSQLTSDTTLSGTSLDVQHAASAFSSYYYRIRPFVGANFGSWSPVLVVSGAYLDNFSNDGTGWAVRRTTYLEETVAWYGQNENAGYYIIVVADRWDWMIASPLMAAPEPPYDIEYRAYVHDASNLVSGGLVLGGDWNGDACPEPGNIYQTDNCFNHFFNYNYIHYGAMKLLFEQVDQLVWCPGCGGSPIKRLGDTNKWHQIDPILSNDNARDWHTYRVEVRSNGLYLYIDNQFKAFFDNTDYINEPYFGVFASTDEYKPSIWIFDYFKVTPAG